MLKAKKKFSKKELKQDKFILTTIKAKEFIENNSRQLTYTAIGVLALIILVYFYYQSKSSAERDASIRLSAAQEQINSGQRENGIAMYREILEQYDGTAAAGYAAFYLGRIFWEDGDYAQAKTYYRQFIDDYAGDNIMSQAALAGYADCLSYEKNYREAANFYEKAARTAPDFPLAVAYLYSAAEAYREAGNIGKAKNLAQKVIDDYENPAFANQAELLLESLTL